MKHNTMVAGFPEARLISVNLVAQLWSLSVETEGGWMVEGLKCDFNIRGPFEETHDSSLTGLRRVPPPNLVYSLPRERHPALRGTPSFKLGKICNSVSLENFSLPSFPDIRPF